MVINIKTNKKKYFRQLLALLGGIPPFKALSAREKDVFASLLYTFYSSTELTLRDRFDEVFSPKNKESIRINLGISKYNLDNLLMSLRKKKFISYDFIYKDHLILPDKEITFKFTS